MSNEFESTRSEKMQALISLSLRSDDSTFTISDEWLSRYCINDVSVEERVEIETAISSSDELFSRWLEVKENIDVYQQQALVTEENAPSFIENIINVFEHYKVAILSGSASTALVYSFAFMFIFVPQTFEQVVDDNYGVIETREFTFPSGSSSIGTTKSLTKLQKTHSQYFIGGVREGVKKIMSNPKDWLTHLPKNKNLPNCDESACPESRKREFLAGKWLVYGYSLCQSSKLDQDELEQHVKLANELSQMINLPFKEFSKANPGNICQINKTILQSIVN